MKHLPLALSTLLILALFTATPALAQHEQHHERQRNQAARSDTMPGMMRGGMMQDGMMGPGMMQRMHGMHQQMMQNPMHRAGMMAFVLPALADTLGLEDQQVEELNELKTEMTEERQRHREEMQAAQQELQALFEDDETPAPEEVRTRLQEVAQLRAEGQAATYEAAQRMREVLTEEQRQMLEEMTPQQIHRHMMHHMTMMDMMQMMQSMAGGMMQQNRQNQ